jgi:hypothetical protein
VTWQTTAGLNRGIGGYAGPVEALGPLACTRPLARRQVVVKDEPDLSRERVTIPARFKPRSPSPAVPSRCPSQGTRAVRTGQTPLIQIGP